MDSLQAIYEAAIHAGLLKVCIWQPQDGSPPVTHHVGFAAPDETLLDGLTLSTEYIISYPAPCFEGMGIGAQVTIDDTPFVVRAIKAVGDGSEMRTQLRKEDQ